MMKNAFKKIMLSMTAIVIAFWAVEASLFIASRIYYHYRLGNTSAALRDAGALRIICIGDSYTFGMGAVRGHSYPEQMHRILKDRLPDKALDVFNMSTPGHTSSRVREMLNEEFFMRYRPDILVVLIGLNDPDGVRENAYAFLPQNSLRSMLHALEYRLERFRTGRILKLAADTILVKVWRMRLSAKYGRSALSGAPRPVDGCTAGRQVRDEYGRLIFLGEQAFNAQKRDAPGAIDAYGKASELMPACDDAYVRLADVYSSCLGKEGYPGEDEVLAILKKAESLNPQKKTTYSLSWRLYYRQGKIAQAREELEKFLYLSPEWIPEYVNVFKYGLPWIDGRGAYLDLYRQNLRKIIDTVRQRRVKLILLGYPQGEDITACAKEVARQNNVPFVDNDASFEILKRNPGYHYSDYFISDGHCTAKGYAVMAQNVARVLREEGFLK